MTCTPPTHLLLSLSVCVCVCLSLCVSLSISVSLSQKILHVEGKFNFAQVLACCDYQRMFIMCVNFKQHNVMLLHVLHNSIIVLV